MDSRTVFDDMPRPEIVGPGASCKRGESSLALGGVPPTPSPPSPRFFYCGPEGGIVDHDGSSSRDPGGIDDYGESAGSAKYGGARFREESADAAVPDPSTSEEAVPPGERAEVSAAGTITNDGGVLNVTNDERRRRPSPRQASGSWRPQISLATALIGF